jgi:hypothetical protein
MGAWLVCTSDLNSLPGAFWQFAEALQRESELNTACQAAFLRIGVRNGIVADLVADRITLLEAAARFGGLNEQLSDGRRLLSASIPARSEGERLCRQVILHVKSWEEERADPDDLVHHQRLEAELEQLLELEGVIRLAPVPRGGQAP